MATTTCQGMDIKKYVMLLPCAGLCTPLLAIRDLGAQCEAIAYETEVGLKNVITEVIGENGVINIGKSEGDWTQVFLRDVPSVDTVATAPPAMATTKDGTPDWCAPESECFVQTLLCIVDQAYRKENAKLRAFIIQAPHEMSQKPMGREDVRSPSEQIEDWLNEQLPSGWNIYLWDMHASHHTLPHHRGMVYICGRMSNMFLTAHPAHLPSDMQLTCKKLREIIDLDVPKYDLDRLETRMWNYVQSFRKQLKSERRKYPEWAISALSIPMVEKVGVKPTYRMDDLCTCLNDNAIWIEGVHPGYKPNVQRFLNPDERVRLQGLPEGILDHIPIELQISSTSQAMPLPCVGICFASLLSDPCPLDELPNAAA